MKTKRNHNHLKQLEWFYTIKITIDLLKCQLKKYQHQRISAETDSIWHERLIMVKIIWVDLWKSLVTPGICKESMHVLLYGNTCRHVVKWNIQVRGCLKRSISPEHACRLQWWVSVTYIYVHITCDTWYYVMCIICWFFYAWFYDCFSMWILLISHD